MLARMQTRKELYETIDYSEYEKLDSTIVASIPPEMQPKGG
jgi:methylisocitrate lyase